MQLCEIRSVVTRAKKMLEKTQLIKTRSIMNGNRIVKYLEKFDELESKMEEANLVVPQILTEVNHSLMLAEQEMKAGTVRTLHKKYRKIGDCHFDLRTVKHTVTRERKRLARLHEHITTCRETKGTRPFIAFCIQEKVTGSDAGLKWSALTKEQKQPYYTAAKKNTLERGERRVYAKKDGRSVSPFAKFVSENMVKARGDIEKQHPHLQIAEKNTLSFKLLASRWRKKKMDNTLGI
eukprot:TRINITY_DN1608_c1_g2_i1.p1 TRINITY_DN1608_c1_g2~~TRINITY_DN1608_c1_g2_i1.p1  ORF type:complete len:236 (+),score=46.44 TRINITY_DN1608_c1_g2_i1:71-778(+)